MVRKFGIEAGHISCGIGACAITGAWSFAGIVYAEGVGAEYFQSYEVGAEIRYAVGREGNQLTLYRSGPSKLAGTMPTKEWLFVGVSKAAGTVKPKLYVYQFSNETWTIGEGNVTTADAQSGATGVVFGQWDNFEQLLGKMAAAAIYDKALTEAEMKALVAVPQLEDWLGTEPKGLWFFNQEKISEAVTDLTGNGADEIGEASSTEVVKEDPPIPYTEGEEGGGGGGIQIFDGSKVVEGEDAILVEGALVAPERFMLIEGALVAI